MRPVPPDPLAPRDVEFLPAYWDERRARSMRPDLSTCAADLRQALATDRRRYTFSSLVIVACAAFVTLFTGVHILATTRAPLVPEPPATMHCVCP